MAWAAPFDPFAALGLERDAAPRSIKSRYHELARRYHPNRNQGPEGSNATLSEHFNHVHRAWQLLRKADKRRRQIELLDLYDLYETTLASAADLLSNNDQPEQHVDQQSLNQDGHVSSSADDDDLPPIPGVKRRSTFDRSPKRANGLEDIEEGGDTIAGSAQVHRKGESRPTKLRTKPGTGKDDEGSDRSVAGERRKKFDKLRKKELDAFYKYRDAMVNKIEAEEAAEMCKEEFEQAKWRREYFDRAPKETSQRVKLIRLFNNATKAFAAQQYPVRRRNRSTVSYGATQILSPIEPVESNQFLGLPSRTKSIHRRGYSSDVSGDQTSSDEEHSSDKATSPSRSPRPSSPRPSRPQHRRWDSVPSVFPVSSHSLPNGEQDPISPITGPGPNLFIRAPTNLNEMIDAPGSDVDSASASSRSPSPQPDTRERGRFTLVPSVSAADIFGCSPERRSRSTSVGAQDRRSRSPGPEQRAPSVNGSGRTAHGSPVDACLFRVKRIGHLQFRNIPKENVHELTYNEKRWMLGVEPDTDTDPATLLNDLSKLDETVATRFMVKPDIKARFNFRLIYSHREVSKQQHKSFIALSYRRKLHVKEKDNHYSLPLEPEMFQAVWDERVSDNEGVWIDQVCIKETEEEKTISMSAMDMVYRSARLAVVALDDIELEAHEAEILDSHMNEFNGQVHVPANKRFRQRQTPYLESHDDLYLVIRKLLRSSWFRRAWCRHEMRLSREHIFLVPCNNPGGKSVLRFTGKCLTHFIALATEVPFERPIEAVKPALYAFFRDRSKLLEHDHDHRLRAHHGNFTTVVAEVFAMEAGGDPRIPEEQREADARKDKISIILNTMECGLALQQKARNPNFMLPTNECYYMLMLLALAARDPGALCSVGHPILHLPYGISSSWLFEPSNVDSGLNNYRTLNRMAESTRIMTHHYDREHFVQLSLKFLRPSKVQRSLEALETLKLARHFLEVCERRNLGRNRKRYLINDRRMNDLFGPMRDVYVETLACVFECGPDWMSDVCQRYGVSRWRHDLQPAYDLLVAFKNTSGRWPEHAWSTKAASFIADFVNFLIIRGMPQRQVTQQENWRPVWVSTAEGGKVVTFIPPGDICCAVPVALLDSDYIHLARLWVLEPRETHVEKQLEYHNDWTLLGKSVVFSDDISIELLEADNGFIRGEQKVFGRGCSSTSHLQIQNGHLR